MYRSHSCGELRESHINTVLSESQGKGQSVEVQDYINAFFNVVNLDQKG